MCHHRINLAETSKLIPLDFSIQHNLCVCWTLGITLLPKIISRINRPNFHAVNLVYSSTVAYTELVTCTGLTQCIASWINTIWVQEFNAQSEERRLRWGGFPQKKDAKCAMALVSGWALREVASLVIEKSLFAYLSLGLSSRVDVFRLSVGTLDFSLVTQLY